MDVPQSFPQDHSEGKAGLRTVVDALDASSHLKRNIKLC